MKKLTQLNQVTNFISGINPEEILKMQDDSMREYIRVQKYDKDFINNKIKRELELEDAYGSKYIGDIPHRTPPYFLDMLNSIDKEREK